MTFSGEKFVSAVERAQLRRQGIRFLNDTAERAASDERVLRLVERAREFSLQTSPRGDRRGRRVPHAVPRSGAGRTPGPDGASVLPFPAKLRGGADAPDFPRGIA